MSFALAVVFVFGNAYFVGAQFALITTRRDQVEPLAEAGARGARSALSQLQSLPRMLAGSQLGIAACSLGLGAVAEPAFAHQLESLAADLHLTSRVATAAAYVLALVFVAFCHMVLGEMVPKNVTLAGPVRAALILAPPMAVWISLTRPVLIALSAVADVAVKLLRLEPKDELRGTYTAEDLAALVDESHSHGFLDAEERDRLIAAASLEQMTARDITIPLERTVTIGTDATVQEIERLSATSGFLRFPVRVGADLRGYVNAKDLIGVDAERDRAVVTELMRPLPAVAVSEPLPELLRRATRGDLTLCAVREGPRIIGIMTIDDALGAVAGVEPGRRTAS